MESSLLTEPVPKWGGAVRGAVTKSDKRECKCHITVAVVVLVGRWVDLYLMILPALGSGPLQGLGTVKAGFAAGGVGIFLLAVSRARESLLAPRQRFVLARIAHRVSAETASTAIEG